MNPGCAPGSMPQEFASPKEYISWFTAELSRNKLFVVVDDQIWHLPRASKPNAKHVENTQTMVEFYAGQSKPRKGSLRVNGVPVTGEYELQNADIICVA